jgi:hypothetical protein
MSDQPHSLMSCLDCQEAILLHEKPLEGAGNGFSWHICAQHRYSPRRWLDGPSGGFVDAMQRRGALCPDYAPGAPREAILSRPRGA